MLQGAGIILGGQHFKKLYEKCMDGVGKKYGLTRAEIDLLLYLRHSSDRTASAAADYLMQARSNVSKNVEELTRRGLIQGTRNEKDRRCVRLQLLPVAEPLLDDAETALNRFYDRLMTGFSPEEKCQLQDMLKRLDVNIRAEMTRREDD